MKNFCQFVTCLVILAVGIGCGDSEPVIPKGQSIANPTGYTPPAGSVKQAETKMPPIAQHQKEMAERLNAQAASGGK